MKKSNKNDETVQNWSKFCEKAINNTNGKQINKQLISHRSRGSSL